MERQEAVKGLRDELFAFASPYRPRIIIISYGRQAPLKRCGTANQPRRFICSETSSSLLPANPNFQSGEFCGLRFIGSRFFFFYLGFVQAAVQFLSSCAACILSDAFYTTITPSFCLASHFHHGCPGPVQMAI